MKSYKTPRKIIIIFLIEKMLLAIISQRVFEIKKKKKIIILFSLSESRPWYTLKKLFCG